MLSPRQPPDFTRPTPTSTPGKKGRRKKAPATPKTPKSTPKEDLVDAPQITDLCFSHSGAAFEPPPGFGDVATFINARAWSNKKFTNAGDTPLDHHEMRSTPALSEKETSEETPPGLLKYLLVGWYLPNSDHAKAKFEKNARPGGVERPEEGGFIK